MADVSEEAIDAALAADQERSAKAREIVFLSPGRDQVRVMLEAAAPKIIAACLSTAPSDGRVVRETWVNWALEQPDVAGHPNWTKPWEELDQRDREVDSRIYSAVAARAVADARLHDDRARAQLFALGAHRGAIFDALRAAAAGSEYGALRNRYLNALKALGGEEDEGRG